MGNHGQMPLSICWGISVHFVKTLHSTRIESILCAKVPRTGLVVAKPWMSPTKEILNIFKHFEASWFSIFKEAAHRHYLVTSTNNIERKQLAYAFEGPPRVPHVSSGFIKPVERERERETATCQEADRSMACTSCKYLRAR